MFPASLFPPPLYPLNLFPRYAEGTPPPISYRSIREVVLQERNAEIVFQERNSVTELAARNVEITLESP